jgi:hypothetical protein
VEVIFYHYYPWHLLLASDKLYSHAKSPIYIDWIRDWAEMHMRVEKKTSPYQELNPRPPAHSQ